MAVNYLHWGEVGEPEKTQQNATIVASRIEPPPPIHTLPKTDSFPSDSFYLYHYNSGILASAVQYGDIDGYEIQLEGEPSGVTAYMHIHADTAQDLQLVRFKVQMSTDMRIEMRVRQYHSSSSDEYEDAVGWTDIEDGGQKEVYVPINKTAVVAGGPTILELRMRMNNNGAFSAGKQIWMGDLVQRKLEYRAETRLATICDDDDKYRYGFNGMEKDNEPKGFSNSLDFGARMYDPRIARWMSVDGMAKKYPHVSTYAFARNNPIVRVDPDGNTDFYFNGKWVGTDGVGNNLIGIVRSKGVSKQIKNGQYNYATDVKNGTSTTDAFFIDATVLKAANAVLTKSLTKEGNDREYATGLNKDENGNYKMINDGIVEGKPAPLNKKGEIPHAKAEVDIHSHPTGAAVIGGQVWSGSATQPSPEDKDNMNKVDMFIIVGKNGFADGIQDKAPDGSLSPVQVLDNRDAAINVYDKDNKETPVQTINQKEASSIIVDYEKR